MISNNKVYFIQALKNIKGVDITEPVMHHMKNKQRCFIDLYWSEKFQLFTEGRIVERDLSEEKIKKLEAQLKEAEQIIIIGKKALSYIDEARVSITLLSKADTYDALADDFLNKTGEKNE